MSRRICVYPFRVMCVGSRVFTCVMLCRIVSELCSSVGAFFLSQRSSGLAVKKKRLSVVVVVVGVVLTAVALTETRPFGFNRPLR